eukprot:PhF_6_TR9984/c0_g1_i4/m.15154
MRINYVTSFRNAAATFNPMDTGKIFSTNLHCWIMMLWFAVARPCMLQFWRNWSLKVFGHPRVALKMFGFKPFDVSKTMMAMMLVGHCTVCGWAFHGLSFKIIWSGTLKKHSYHFLLPVELTKNCPF